jgi:predicted nucleic acid-binding protein
VILVDSSAWIELLRHTGSPVESRLRAAIDGNEQLAIVGVVLLELLAGARDEAHATRLRRMLAGARLLRLEEPSDHESAAGLYRACRRGGSTIRRLPDCLIAAVAIRHGIDLLHQDSDFDELARHTALSVVTTA